MSTISNPITSSAASAQSALSSSTALGGVAPTEDTFLQLLVSQLQNQDPLNPADSTQFVGELAQFTSVEQLMQINQNTATLPQVFPATTSASSASSSGSSAASSAASALSDALGSSLATGAQSSTNPLQQTTGN